MLEARGRSVKQHLERIDDAVLEVTGTTVTTSLISPRPISSFHR